MDATISAGEGNATLLNVHTLHVNVTPYLLHFLSTLPDGSLPLLKEVYLYGRFRKGLFMDPMDVEGFMRVHENVADFMHRYGKQLEFVDVSDFDLFSTSDMRAVLRVLPAGDGCASQDRHGLGEDESGWEWHGNSRVYRVANLG